LLTGLMLVVFIEPPFKFLAVIREYRGARWPLLLVALSLVGFGAVWIVPPTRGFFGLAVEPDPVVVLALLAVTAVWSVFQRTGLGVGRHPDCVHLVPGKAIPPLGALRWRLIRLSPPQVCARGRTIRAGYGRGALGCTSS